MYTNCTVVFPGFCPVMSSSGPFTKYTELGIWSRGAVAPRGKSRYAALGVDYVQIEIGVSGVGSNVQLAEIVGGVLHITDYVISCCGVNGIIQHCGRRGRIG